MYNIHNKGVVMEKYDGVIFGNGMTINLLSQLKRLFPEDKLYLLSLDDFMKAFYQSKLSLEEDNRVFSIYYKRKDISSLQYFQRMKSEFENYYELYNGNIEYHFGSDLFNDKFIYNNPLMKSLFPAFYNIWFEILFDYIEDVGLGGYVSKFYSSFSEIINTSNIWTTNFDRFADKVIKVGHIHGSFVTKLKNYKELIYYFKDENNFCFKCIWGWNGLGKYTTIQEYIKCKDYQDYFDFSIFISDVIYIKNLLLYGVGFQKSGFIADLAEKYPKYKKPIIGGGYR